MQIAFPKNSLPPSQGGGTSDIASQLHQQQMNHQRIFRGRTLQLWWYRILLIVLAVLVAAIAGLVTALLGQTIIITQVALKCLLIVGVSSVALLLLFVASRRIAFGLFLTAIVSTTFFPEMFAVKSLEIFPVLPALMLLFFVLLVQTAFHVREPIFPSFWAIWPQLGLIVTAFISFIMVQLTWTASVPHKINSTPIIYDQILGIGVCFVPLIAIMFTTMALTKKDHYIQYILHAFLILGCIAAAIIIIEFKRIGASIYTFRYSEPMILWMKLRGMAQLITLAALIAYARFLYATRWRMRLFYGVLLVICLIGVYFTLENSWWLEAGIALMAITIAYSRRLFLSCCIAALPLIPVIKAELTKLATVKSADYYRLVIWQDALRVWSKQRLFGVGPGDFWAYDQHFTQLPRLLRNCNLTGLCVAHNGYLQVLAEMGLLGLFFWLAMIVVIATIAVKLFRRSSVPRKRSGGIAGLIGLNLACESEKLNDCILGLVGLGLIFGSAAADFFSGSFFLPPRQVNSFKSLPLALTSWFIWGCIVYKDQLWRMARKKSKIEDQ